MSQQHTFFSGRHALVGLADEDLPSEKNHAFRMNPTSFCYAVKLFPAVVAVALWFLFHKIGSRNFRHFYLFPKIMLFAKHSDASV